MAGTVSVFILAIGSVFDIVNRKIPALYIYCSIAVSFVISIISLAMDKINANSNVFDYMGSMMVGMVPGLIIYIISVSISGIIGKGDGLIITSIGMLMGIKNITIVLLTSLCIAAVIAIILITFWKKDRKSMIPFVPVLFVAQSLFLLAG